MTDISRVYRDSDTQSSRLYLFVEAAEVSVLPHAVQDLRCCFHHFRTMSGNSAETKTTYSIKLGHPMPCLVLLGAIEISHNNE